MPTLSRVPETVDLADPDRQLTDPESSDTIHRAGYPRSAVGAVLGDDTVGVVTGWAADIADARCGVPVDLPPGPHPGRGTLRWYRHYIAHLDDCADTLTPGWRELPCPIGPYPWCDVAFGPISRRGRSALPPCAANSPGYDRDPERPRAVGYWTFDMPPAQIRP